MVSARRPAGLAKKLKTRLVLECITVSHLENALDMSKAQATSFVRSYYANEDIRFDRSEPDAYDDMLLQRSRNMIGWKRAHGLLGADKKEVEAQERHTQLQSNMDRLEQKMSTQLEEMQKKMQEQHSNLLAALQPLMPTTLPTQGSTSAPQPSSTQYARTGVPVTVFDPPAPNGDNFKGPVNGGATIHARDGGGHGYGQGSRNQERDLVIQTPPRRSIQGQNSTPHPGAQEPYGMPPSRTRVEAREASYAPPAQTGAGESVSVFPADLVFWQR